MLVLIIDYVIGHIQLKRRGQYGLPDFFWIEDTLYEQQWDAVDYLYKQNLSSDEIELRTLLNQLNGQWAFIYKKFDLIYFCDGYDAFPEESPIFYSKKNNQIGISDDGHYLVTTNKLKNYLEDNTTAYLNQYSAFSGETLFDDLYDIQAGEYITIQNTHLTKQQYWNFPKKRQLKSKPTQVDLNEIIKCFDKVFGRMIRYLSEKNQIVYLPLSGGMDSRLLAWALKKYKFRRGHYCIYIWAIIRSRRGRN